MTLSFQHLVRSFADRYRIERELGAGGMATVYLAEDLKHDRKVAIKVLKPELAAVLGAERFVVEIKTTAALSHPHILPLFDSGTADGFLFYVMPFIQGETIREKLNRETQFGVDEAVRIAREVADALDYDARSGTVSDWSRDGRHIALSRPAAAGAQFPEIWVLDVATGARRRMFEETGSVSQPRFAPDGRRVVYVRDDALFVRPFPGPGVAVRVFAGAGRSPAWSADGKSLYFEDAGGNIAVVPVGASGEATALPAIALPRERIEQLRPEYEAFEFDVAPTTNDIFVKAIGNRRHSLTLVQNWPALLARKR